MFKQFFVHWMCQQSFLFLLTITDINLKADSMCSQPDYVANLKRCKKRGHIKYKRPVACLIVMIHTTKVGS